MFYNTIGNLICYFCLYFGVVEVLAQQSVALAQQQQQQQQQQPLLPPSNSYELLKQLPETYKFLSLLDLELQLYLQNQTNITVFAPYNDAFHHTLLLDRNTTRYHILPQLCLDDCWNDGPLYKSTSYMKLWTNRNKNTKQIESGNMQSAAVINSIQIPSQRSVVHIIDSILTVPLDIETTLETLKFTKAKEMISQVRQNDKAGNNSEFDEMLTLFMPNNQAFGTVDPKTLGFDINAMIYNAHAVKGLFISKQLKYSNNTIQNLAGSNIKIHANQISINNNTANIIIKDIIAENAIIHSIDQSNFLH
ncbi:hypothetical protein INT46_004888, partial [Mucor plumbeus]